jgi:hypothetical protein
MVSRNRSASTTVTSVSSSYGAEAAPVVNRRATGAGSEIPDDSTTR